MSIPMPPPMPGSMPPPPPPFVGGVPAMPAMPPATARADAVSPVPGAVPMPPWQAAPPQAPAQEFIPAAPAMAPAAVPAQELVPAQARGGGMVAMGAVDFENMSFEEIALAQGIVGLDFKSFGVLPNCSLNKGAFKLSDGTSLGTEFVCTIQEVRPKFLYKTAVADQDPRHSVCYSYDHQTSNGKPLQPILDGWAAQGLSHETKQYLECTCVLDDSRVILLSVPQTSISRLTSHVITVTVSKRLLSQVKTRVSIGPEVKSKFPFTPMSFEVYAG